MLITTKTLKEVGCMSTNIVSEKKVTFKEIEKTIFERSKVYK